MHYYNELYAHNFCGLNFLLDLFIQGFTPLQESQNYTVARDSFLAHLGATLWGSMRHIVSPSVADGAFHYYEKISFQLFFVTQEVRCLFEYLKRLTTVEY